MSLQNFAVQTIKTFFQSANSSFYVPNYQRDYSWDEKVEVNDLWEDFYSVFINKIPEYFIGQIVVHVDENNKLNLIDGQQRTATIFILYLALRDKMDEMAQTNNYNPAQTKDLINKSNKINSILEVVDESDNDDKLFLGDADRDFFRDMIYRTQTAITLREKRPSRKRLIATYKFFYKKLTDTVDDISGTDGQYRFVIDFYNCLCNNFRLLYVETNDEAEAFMIFETLNARGKDLETSDLLKNYFFRTGSNNLDKIKKNWTNMSDTFENYSITPYIRCLWNSKHEFCREKMLYRSIKKGCANNAQCLKFTNELCASTDVYLSMLDPENNTMFSSGSKKDEIQEILKTLSRIGIKTYYPLILAYYNTYISSHTLRDDILRILEAVRKLIVRDLVIAKGNPSSYEVVFADMAKRISDLDLVEVKDIINEIKANSIGDAQFESAFKEYKEKDSGAAKEKIRYILRSIINKQSAPMNVITNNMTVNIEHIMPQKIAGTNWQIPKDDHVTNLWKLGNLTLIENTINISASNADFDVKKTYYAQSKIKLTKDLSNLSSWDIAAIDKRQDELWQIAKDIWSF